MARLLTTMLFVPGSDTGRMQKIPSLSARAFILDLEDAVALTAKAAARSLVADFLQTHGRSHGLDVRVNSVDSGFLYEDLRAVVVPGLSGIDLPKVSSARDIHVADWLIGALERERDLPVGRIELMGTIETVHGVEHCREIAAASPRLRRLCFGAGDFSLDIGIDWPAPAGSISPTIVGAKSEVVLASRLVGLEPPHDGVYPNFRDIEGLRLEAELGRSLGFFGKHVIHPDQIAVVEEVFRPTPEQVQRARRLVEAFESAEGEGRAAVSFEGQLVDYPVVSRAKQLLESVEGLR